MSFDRPSSQPVLDRQDPASVATCPYGGSIVNSGFDDNGNGTLEDAEIRRRTAVCNLAPDEPPPPLVFRLVPEAAGAMCERDGTAVQSGRDRNRNGRLDDDEVENVEYACGEPMLTRLAAEPAGARCPGGGVAVLIGRDRDHDGVLGDGEIEVTEVQCGSEVSGDVALHSAADVAALANIALIAGSLTVADTGLAELALPRLVEIRGALAVERNAQLARISMPALQAVDGRFTLALNERLDAIELPALHRVDGLTLAGNRALADLSGLSGLTDVIHDVLIEGNDAMTAADLPVERVDGVVTVGGNPVLAQLTYRAAGTRVIVIASNPALTSVEIEPANLDHAGEIRISSNAQLAHVAVGTFGALGGIRIEDNPQLSSVEVSAFRIASDLVLSGNGPLDVTLSSSSLVAFTITGSLRLAGPIRTFDSSKPLQVGGDLEVRNNAALASLDFLSQDQIDGDVTVSDNAALAAAPSLGALRRVRGTMRIASNPALKALELPALTAVTSIDVRDNAELRHLRLPVLGGADLDVFDNPHLPACEVEALFAGMLGEHHQSGNDETAVCP